MLHRPSPARRTYELFRLRSFSASMSMACCATIFFNRGFLFPVFSAAPSPAPSSHRKDATSDDTLLADLLLPANRLDGRALVEVHFRLVQLRNDLLRRVPLPFHRVLLPSRAIRLSYQLVQMEGVIPQECSDSDVSIVEKGANPPSAWYI